VASTRKLAKQLARYLKATGHPDLAEARRLARAVKEADGLGEGDARWLALAEARDKARSLRFALGRARTLAVTASRHTQDEVDFVVDASPWIGDERLAEAQQRNRNATQRYGVEAGALGHLRRLLRGIDRDLAAEAAAARRRGMPRATGIARRLVEKSVWIDVRDPSGRRRRHWSALADLADGPHPARAQLAYGLGCVVRAMNASRDLRP
jgi:hypothetical protein